MGNSQAALRQITRPALRHQLAKTSQATRLGMNQAEAALSNLFMLVLLVGPEGTMNKAVILMAFALTACTSQPAEPSFVGNASKGATVKKMQNDGAQCRGQARSVAGSSQYAAYRELYTDCMLRKGYELVNVVGDPAVASNTGRT
jgi:hypothetical protein